MYEGVGSDLVVSTVDGFNTSIFAYGQTGTGKSYSILGTDRDGTCSSAVVTATAVMAVVAVVAMVYSMKETCREKYTACTSSAAACGNHHPYTRPPPPPVRVTQARTQILGFALTRVPFLSILPTSNHIPILSSTTYFSSAFTSTSTSTSTPPQ